MGAQAGVLQKVGYFEHIMMPKADTTSPDLRARFLRSELALFRHRFETDDVVERAAFLTSLQFDWQLVDASEKGRLETELKTCLWASGNKDEAFRAESWFKVRSRLLLELDLILLGPVVYRPRPRGTAQGVY